MSREEAIERRMIELREKGPAYAEAMSDLTRLEEFKKSKLAILMKKYERLGVTSAAGQERDARADQEYLALIDGLAAAVKQVEQLRWEREIAKMGIDVWRTLESSRRKEMEGYGI